MIMKMETLNRKEKRRFQNRESQRRFSKQISQLGLILFILQPSIYWLTHLGARKRNRQEACSARSPGVGSLCSQKLAPGLPKGQTSLENSHPLSASPQPEIQPENNHSRDPRPHTDWGFPMKEILSNSQDASGTFSTPAGDTLSMCNLDFPWNFFSPKSMEATQHEGRGGNVEQHEPREVSQETSSLFPTLDLSSGYTTSTFQGERLIALASPRKHPGNMSSLEQSPQQTAPGECSVERRAGHTKVLPNCHQLRDRFSKPSRKPLASRSNQSFSSTVPRVVSLLYEISMLHSLCVDMGILKKDRVMSAKLNSLRRQFRSLARPQMTGKVSDTEIEEEAEGTESSDDSLEAESTGEEF